MTFPSRGLEQLRIFILIIGIMGINMKKTLFSFLTFVVFVALFIGLDSLSKLIVPFERPRKQSSDNDIFLKSPTRVNQMKPSAKFKLEGKFYTTNSLGFRDREFPPRKKKGSLRIAILGDSFIEGAGEEQDKTIPKIIETILRKKIGSHIEIMNCGIRGGAPSLYQFWIQDLMEYDVDFFVVCLFSNDMGDDAYWKIINHYARTEGYWNMPPILKKFNFFKYLFSYIGYAKTRSARIQYTKDTFGIHPFYKEKGRPDGNPHAVGQNSFGYMVQPKLWEAHWERTKLFLEKCVEILDKKNKPYLITYFPAPEFFLDMNVKSKNNYLSDHFSFWLDEWAQKNGVSFYNLYGMMEKWYKNPDNPTLRNTRNAHFNERGLKVVGSWIAERLLNREEVRRH